MIITILHPASPTFGMSGGPIVSVENPDVLLGICIGGFQSEVSGILLLASSEPVKAADSLLLITN